MPRDLIVFGEDWGGLPSSTQHLVKNLANDRKVLWINSIGLRRPNLSCHDLTRVVNKIAHRINSDTHDQKIAVPNNITILNPLTIPAPRCQVERSFAAHLLEKQIKPEIEALKLHQPILWISLPTAADLVGRLGESATIYYCGDDFSSLAGVDHRIVEKHEEKLVKNCDLIITASEKLAERFPQQRTRTLTHGVDYDLFSQRAYPAKDLPYNGQPTAGFYGSLSAWLDTELLSKVIASMPHWNFVFIGKEEADMSMLKTFKNTYFLGPRQHKQLPSYSQHWQASLLPFRDNAQIRACNPLKLVEYLAGGRPVVSTSFPALMPYRHLVQSTKCAEDFVEALEISLNLDTLESFPTALRSTVSNNTWQEKSCEVANWLEKL